MVCEYGSILTWLSSYLSNRQQIVKINGFKSKAFTAYSGIPQGSHLGPLLFILFINDKSDVITFSNFLIYADDLKLFQRIDSINDQCSLQMDLENVYNWSIANRLYLNNEKFNKITFGRSNVNKLSFNYMMVILF